MKEKYYWVGFEWENKHNPKFHGTYCQCVIYMRNHYFDSDIKDMPEIIDYETGRGMSFVL